MSTLPQYLTPSMGAARVPEPIIPAPIATFEDLIHKQVADKAQAADSTAAAVAASAKATADAATSAATDDLTARYLAISEPVTIPQPDGSFLTYEQSPSGFRVEKSLPASTPLPTLPTPTPATNPPTT